MANKTAEAKSREATYQRAYHAKNRDRRNAQKREKYAAEREKYAAEREKYLARHRAYYAANRERVIARMRAYRKKAGAPDGTAA